MTSTSHVIYATAFRQPRGCADDTGTAAFPLGPPLVTPTLRGWPHLLGSQVLLVGTKPDRQKPDKNTSFNLENVLMSPRASLCGNAEVSPEFPERGSSVPLCLGPASPASRPCPQLPSPAVPFSREMKSKGTKTWPLVFGVTSDVCHCARGTGVPGGAEAWAASKADLRGVNAALG